MTEGSQRLPGQRRFVASMLCVLSLFLLDGCAARGTAPAGARSNPVPVVGAGTISWSLLVLSWHRPDGYEYLAYVDGTRVRLADVRCQRADTVTYSCVAPLPPLRPGRHEIQLATLDAAAGLESLRSGIIVVAVTSGP